MTNPTMDVLDIIRKRGEDRDVDFLRETLQVVLHAVMDADVSAQIGAQLRWQRDHDVRLRQPVPAPDGHRRCE